MRLRLPADVERNPPPTSIRLSDGPVTLFLPARNEEPRVGAVLHRCPPSIGGHAVRRVVVDDASTDDTAAVAAEAGADVIRLPFHRGLGAAVRIGLADALAHGSAAVAFCDADGEYAPEELPALVLPVLQGRADYVVGSRFLGSDRHMLMRRQAGNRALTRALRYITRTRITDGQSGFRALSARAAAVAEIAHDYNYAQVLTLDLLTKGMHYGEVPITYRFRTSGRSFVRLGPYLRHVAPATLRVVNGVKSTQPGRARRPAPAGPPSHAHGFGDGFGDRLVG